MTNLSTHRQLKVRDGGTVGPYIMLQTAQLAIVESILAGNGIRYWVDDVSVAIDHGPPVIAITMGREHTVAEVQPLLDAVA